MSQSKVATTVLMSVLSVSVLLLIPVLLLAQATEVPPEPEAIRSLFAGDTCSPPCWFGLIPGESTSEQVAEFFKNNLDLFSEQWPAEINGKIDLKTGYLIQGFYSFYWAGDHTAQEFGNPQTVHIDENILDRLAIRRLNTQVTLTEMLDVFGYPEHMYLWDNSYGDIFLGAIYETHRIEIHVESPHRFDDCTFSDFRSTYLVDGITYYSPDDTSLLVTRGFDVSVEQLQKWLNHEENRTCIEVWQELRDSSQTDASASG